MRFREQTLEDIIWGSCSTIEGRQLLKERGLCIYGNIYKQIDLGSYGRADLITVMYDHSNNVANVTVYELKLGSITKEAFMQACRYVIALKRHGFLKEYFGVEFNYKICLIGDRFDPQNDFCYLYCLSPFADAYVYDYKIDGISFEYVDKNWCKTNEVLNENSSELIGVELDHEILIAREDDTAQ